MKLVLFSKFIFENVKIGGTKISGQQAPLGPWSSIIIPKGWNCVLGYVEILLSKSSTQDKNSKLVKNRKNHENREISRFFPNLRASNSENMASIQVFLHTHINVFGFNGSSNGHLNWRKATAIMVVLNLRLKNGDNFWKCWISYIFKDF